MSPGNQTKKLPRVPLLESAGCAGLGAGLGRSSAREASRERYLRRCSLPGALQMHEAESEGLLKFPALGLPGAALVLRGSPSHISTRLSDMI